ncbi:unnamed protein product [Closterium sp. Naga37s-1]|nr:unnamed protein product [Closterium sp. Naga37s-1]
MAADNRLTLPRGSSSNPQAARNASHTAQNAAPNPTAAAELLLPSFHVDVAIAGGGLAGLALAAGLQARGIEAAVFEAAPAVVRSNNSTGTILGMFPNGYKALEGLKPGLGNAVIASGSPLTKTKLSFRDFPADITGSDSVNASTSGPATNDAAMKGTSENCDGWVVMEAAPQEQTIVGWARAQEVLASSLTQPESIMHGHRVVAYYPVVAGIPVGSGLLGGGGGSESGDGVGDGEVEAVDVVLEVAGSNPEADAHNSSFADLEGAESAYEAGAVEQQRQLVVIRAKILVAADGVRSVVSAADPDGHLKAKLEQTPFGVFGKPGVKGRLMCHVSKNIADPSAHDTWHNILKVATSTHSCNIYERWMMDRPPPKDSWSDSKCGNRVVLMGDAAHAMHPGPGQGPQIAFEDAHQLSLCLADIKDVLAEPAAVVAAVREPHYDSTIITMAAVFAPPAVGLSALPVAMATCATRILRLGMSRMVQRRRMTIRRRQHASSGNQDVSLRGMADSSLTQPQSSSSPAVRNAPNTAREAAPIPAAELPPPSFHVDVAIAGGGLAGLALAAGLQARGVEVAVFEAAPALRSDNSTVLVIWPNGAAALDGILPGLSATMARHGTLVKRRSLCNRRKPPPPPGEAESGLGESGCAESGGSGRGGARAGGGSAVGSDGAVQSSDWLVAETEEAGLNMVPWRRIQEALVSALPRPDLVRCGHRVVGYRPVLTRRGSGEGEAGDAGGTRGAWEAGGAGRAGGAGGMKGAGEPGERSEVGEGSEVEAVDVICEVAGSNPGETQIVVVRAKVLVGADGVRSVVRD